MYPKVKELYLKAKTYLSHKNHMGASVPLGAVAVAIILSAGLIFQVKVLQQQTHTTSKASANSCIQTGCPSGYVCQSVCPTGISCNSTATVCVDVNGATPTPSDSGSPTPTSSPNSTPTPGLNANLTNGLVSYYSLDETSGNTVADLNTTNNGTVTGTAIVEGKFGKARSFTVDTDKIELGAPPSFINIANNLTLSAWVNGSDLTGIKEIVYKPGRGSFDLSVQDNRPRIDVWNGEWKFCRGFTVLAPNTWYHITGTYDRQNLKIYVNGVLDRACAQNTIVDASTEPIFIGHSETNNQTWKGVIDEVGIWNRALTGEEILSLANGARPSTVGSALSPTPTLNPNQPPAPTVEAVFDCVNQNQIGDYVFQVNWPATLTGVTAVQIATQPGFGGDVYTSRNMTQKGNTYLVKGPAGFVYNGADLKPVFQVGKPYYVRIFKGDSLPGPVASFTVPACSATSIQPSVALVTMPTVSKNDPTITFSWNFGSGADGFERVNIYPLGTPNSQPPLTSVYLNCSGQPPAAAIPSGSCTIINVMNTQDISKQYELRMFAKDGQTVIATYGPIQLTE